ncbi:MAG: PKD domain-containing protein [Bacteroidia bacterium]|nr:PKD domain-containing protein [Bacteroidia bacterium]
MKSKFKLLFLLSILLSSSAANASYCWVQRTNIGASSRYAAMGFSIGSKGYVACGYDGSGNTDLWEYDAISNSWTQKANYPGPPIWAGAGFSIGNKGYITVGTGGSNYPTGTYEYDPSANSWATKASFPGTPRQDCWGFGIGNFGYIVAGWKPSYHSDCWKFDPVANIWTQVAPYGGGAISGLRGFVLGGKAYAVGGLSSFTNGTNQVWAYDPNTNSWTAKASLPGTGRHSTCAFEMGGKGIVGGGFNSSTPFADFFEYNDVTNTWTTITPYSLTRPLGYPACFTIGSEGYISTGQVGSTSVSAQTWMLTNGISSSISYTTNACADNYTFTSNAPGATTFSWDFGDGLTSTLANPSHQYTTAGPYTITLTVANGGCTSTTTQNITVIAPVTASFTPTIDQCNSTVSFQNSSQNATNFSWNFGDGQTSSVSSPTHTYSTPGQYTVTLISQSGASALCSDTDSIVITINPGVNATAVLNEDCNNGVNISGFNTNATSITWLWGDGTQTVGSTSYHQYSTSGNYSIQLIISNSNCTDTISFPVTIKENPTAAFTGVSDCNLNAVLTNNSTTGATYNWDWGNGQSSSGVIPSYSYSSAGPYTITLIVIKNGCSDTTSQNINIFTPVNCSFQITDDCQNGINITNNTTGATNYTWNWGDGNNSSGLLTNYTYSQNGIYTVTLIASNNNCIDSTNALIPLQTTPTSEILSQFSLCHDSIYLSSTFAASQYSWEINGTTQSLDSSLSISYASPSNLNIVLVASNGVCQDSDTATITLAGSPDASFITTSGCNGTVSAIPVSTNLSNYNWDLGNGTQLTTEQVNYTYPTSGDQTISLIVSNGFCTDTSEQTINITLGSTYGLNLSIDSCKKSVFVSISPDTAVQIIWQFGDGTTLFGNNMNHSFNLSELYNNVVYIDTGSACADTISFDIDFSLINNGEHTFIPNSFSPNNDLKNDYFYISNSICNFARIEIYNRWGQEVYASDDQNFKWDGKHNGTNLPEGVYLYLIKTNTEKFSGTISIFR